MLLSLSLKRMARPKNLDYRIFVNSLKIVSTQHWPQRSCTYLDKKVHEQVHHPNIFDSFTIVLSWKMQKLGRLLLPRLQSLVLTVTHFCQVFLSSCQGISFLNMSFVCFCLCQNCTVNNSISSWNFFIFVLLLVGFWFFSFHQVNLIN